MSSVVEAETLLAVDVGSVNTRAALFDVVEGRYRLVAAAKAPSTAAAPLLDVREGVRSAMDQIQAVSGRRLVDETESLIMPVTGTGAGVDVFVATTSAGPRVRTVLVGLMPGVSMQSGRRLAASTYLNVVEQIDLLDRRREEEQIDLILQARPDLIMVVGGTDGGATDSILRMVETVSLSAALMAEGQRPQVVYAGNRQLAAAVAERFGDRVELALTPNVRPSLSMEDLAPTRLRMAEAISEARSSRVSGYGELTQWSGGHLMLTADAFGRVLRYLSQVYDPSKGVLGVDLGASHVTIGAAFAGELRLSVRSDLGLGSSLPDVLKHSSIDQISEWLPEKMASGRIRDHIFNKALHPGTVPVEKDELNLEYALARVILRNALAQARKGWPPERGARAVLLPPMEPIVVGGGVFAATPHPGFAALAILDALEPTGITTLVLDPHSATAALGAAAAVLPIVAIQVLGSGTFVSLGTVVAPVGGGRVGRPALRLQLERESGGRPVEGEVRLGQLAVIPLAQGEHGRLTLQPERGFDVGFGGPGRAGAVRVAGGAIGLMIDARGRPLQLPKELERRQELNKKWLWDIGAEE